MLGAPTSPQPADLSTPPSSGPPELARLVRAVEDPSSDASELRVALSGARALLADRGVDETLVDAVDAGFASGSWDDAVAALARSRESDVLFYLGPMRPNERSPFSIGLVLGRRDPIASRAFAVVRDSVEDLGAAMFGFPCSFRGREVEFFHLEAAGGGAVCGQEAAIALFTPFYLGGWSDQELQTRAGKRTLLWSDIVVERHRAIAAPISRQRLLIDGAPARILAADDTTLYACAGLWLSLHELFHGSGPLPLFEPASYKSALASYGAVEESRVDMTAFLSMARGEPYGPLSRMVAELIVIERLLRSARCGAAEVAAARSIGLDGQHGLIWAGVLYRAGALSPATASEPARLDFDSAVAAITEMLRTVYEAESATVDEPVGRRKALERLARSVNATLLGPRPHGAEVVAGLSSLAPVTARVVPGPLTAS